VFELGDKIIENEHDNTLPEPLVGEALALVRNSLNLKSEHQRIVNFRSEIFKL
jgi:hypothetical protein